MDIESFLRRLALELTTVEAIPCVSLVRMVCDFCVTHSRLCVLAIKVQAGRGYVSGSEAIGELEVCTEGVEVRYLIARGLGEVQRIRRAEEAPPT
ncbi:MAG: hypothetical protein IKR31_00400 [Prevotella sp.]|nr:hypothetical protein [Prevotella sp.]